MKYSTLTYKQRNIGLLVGGLIFIIISYVGAIRKTVELYGNNNQLSESIAQHVNTSAGIGNARKKLNDLERYLKLYSLDSTKNQQYIMSEVSNLCKRFNVTLRSFPKAVSSAEKGFVVLTNVIETEGSFNDQLQVIYTLETKTKIGRVSSVIYRSYTDNKSKKLKLSLIIYLQNVTKG